MTKITTAGWVRLRDLGFYTEWLAINQDMSYLERSLGLIRDSNHWSRRFEYPWAVMNATLTKQSIVLDAGGGMSSFQYYLATLCGEVVNVDHDLIAMENARKTRSMLPNLNLTLCFDDLKKVGYGNSYFDYVFCISTLEHCHPPHKHILDEMLRVLKPNGALFMTIDVPVFDTNPQKVDSYLLFKDVQELLKPYGRLPFPFEATFNIQTSVDRKEEMLIGVLCVKLVKE